MILVSNKEIQEYVKEKYGFNHFLLVEIWHIPIHEIYWQIVLF